MDMTKKRVNTLKDRKIEGEKNKTKMPIYATLIQHYTWGVRN